MRAMPAAAPASARTPPPAGTPVWRTPRKRSWKAKQAASTPAEAAISAQPPYERWISSTANSGTSKPVAMANTPPTQASDAATSSTEPRRDEIATATAPTVAATIVAAR